MKQYKNGYAEKINYWTTQLNMAVDCGNAHLMSKAMSKLEYFTARQVDHIEGRLQNVKTIA